jgi:antitoxin component YwqK of YwqJK toxin-antitoxin module
MHSSDTSLPEIQIMEELDEAGRLSARSSWQAGVAQGPMTRYGADGEVLLQAEFRQGRLSGSLRIHDEFGALLRVASYAEGRLHGEALSYRDGKLASRQQYELGLLHGP